MDLSKMLKFADSIVFARTGKHLDDLQIAILKGVLEKQRYSQVAEQFHCTEGHVKDVSYEMWSLLSEEMGEEVNKTNLVSALDRYEVSSIANFGNNVQIGNVNICTSRLQNEKTDSEELKVPEKDDHLDTQVDLSDEVILRSQNQYKAERTIKLSIVPKLVQLGLSPDQIVHVLDLDLEEVVQAVSKQS